MSPAATSADPYVPGHGDLRYAVHHYDLELVYKPVSNHLEGTAVLQVELLAPTRRIDLDLYGLKVSKVTGSGVGLRQWRQDGAKVVLRFDAEYPAGTIATFSLSYKGNPAPMGGPDGEAGWEELTDGVIVASQPHGSPTWFPCNDRAADKASYRLAIATDPAYTVVGSGRLVERRTKGARTRWVYEQPEPMAPYLATVQLGRYEVTQIAQSPIPIRVAAPAGLRERAVGAFADLPRMVEVFTEAFGPYPFAAGYTAVVTEDPLEIPLESQTLATFGSNHANRQWPAQRLIAHELAHQWHGNAVTARRWSDIWLHEGFACYAEWLWSPVAGDVSTQVQASRHWQRLAALPQDLVLAAPGPEAMFDDRVYKRGALTLHALRSTIGDETFFAMVRSWVAEHSGGVADTDDFVDLVARTCPPRVVVMLRRWLYEPALPSLPRPGSTIASAAH